MTEKKLECLLTVKSGDKSMTLTIGEDGFDTDEWIEAFKANFPDYPDGEYEASFSLDGHEYPLGTYECSSDVEVLSSCEGDEMEKEDVPEEVMEDLTELTIVFLGMHIFSDLLNAVMCVALQETAELLDMSHGTFVIEIG